MAEWSKAPALGAGLARGVGSNPTVVTELTTGKPRTRSTVLESYPEGRKPRTLSTVLVTRRGSCLWRGLAWRTVGACSKKHTLSFGRQPERVSAPPINFGSVIMEG